MGIVCVYLLEILLELTLAQGPIMSQKHVKKLNAYKENKYGTWFMYRLWTT